MLTFGASRCSRRLAGGITAGPDRGRGQVDGADAGLGVARRGVPVHVGRGRLEHQVRHLVAAPAASRHPRGWSPARACGPGPRPSLSGSMPIIQRGSSHSERSSLYSRSVLMLPDPTIATDFFCAMDVSSYSNDSRTEPSPAKSATKSSPGTGVDRPGARPGQHDVAGLQPHPEAVDLAGQPGHRGDRVAQHRVAAALGDHLAVAGQHRVDALDVDVLGRHPLRRRAPNRPTTRCRRSCRTA